MNPDFLGTIPAVTGAVPLSEIIDIIFSYDTALVPPDFRSYLSDEFPANDTLSTMGVGRGYIVKSRSDAGVEPFLTKRDLDPANLQFPDTDIPVPIKLRFTGKVLAEENPDAIPVAPITAVKPPWNLVGPHSERDTTVGVFLGPVAPTFSDRKWSQLIAFNNLLDISLDSDGNVKLRAEGKPEIVFTRRFESLRPPAGFPDAGPDAKPSGDPVPAGVAFWLLMDQAGELSGPLE